MKSRILNKSSAAALLAALALSGQAFADTGIGAPEVYLNNTGTEEGEEDTETTVTFDEETEVTTSTTTTTVDLTDSYFGEDYYFGPIGEDGRIISAQVRGSATVSRQEESTQTFTSTPDGEDGFIVDLVEESGPTPVGEATVETLQYEFEARSASGGYYGFPYYPGYPYGMGGEDDAIYYEREATVADGELGETDYYVADISRNGIVYESGSGSVSFDPETQLVTAGEREVEKYTYINEDGVDTNGVVRAGSIVTSEIDMQGGVISNLGAGVEDGDAVNVAQLNAETTARLTGDRVLQENIDAETAARIAALSMEAGIRASADEALSDRIDQETLARIAGFNQLDGRINQLGGRVTALEVRVDDLEDKVASSAAVAMALSGGVLLPGSKFSMTSNLATYDGANAGAIQFNYLVNDKFVINGGVAGGFNKGGDVGGRVGFSFGW